MRKRILFVATGGTIASEMTAFGLKPGVSADEQTEQTLMAYARKHIAKYALPYDIEFRQELPKTLVGKVAYRELEEEEAARRKAEENQEEPVGI